MGLTGICKCIEIRKRKKEERARSPSPGRNGGIVPLHCFMQLRFYCSFICKETHVLSHEDRKNTQNLSIHTHFKKDHTTMLSQNFSRNTEISEVSCKIQNYI